jgi:hypothetical protein
LRRKVGRVRYEPGDRLWLALSRLITRRPHADTRDGIALATNREACAQPNWLTLCRALVAGDVDAGAGSAVAQVRAHLLKERPEDGADVLGAESGCAADCFRYADRLAVLDDDVVQFHDLASF